MSAEIVSSDDLQDIYSNGVASLEYLRMLVAETQPKKILELGTHRAVSTRYMASALGSEGHITSIDLYPPTAERSTCPTALAPNWRVTSLNEVQGFVDRSGWSDKITLVKGDTHARETYSQVTGPFDLLFIDAQHTFGAVMRDYGMTLPLLTQDHILVFDDAGGDGCTVREFVSYLHYPFRVDLPYHGGVTTLTADLKHLPGIFAAAIHARGYSARQQGVIEH